MKLKMNTRPVGQSLIIFIFLSFGLLALLALSLDFGFAMYSRRVAQNAADSAALAAARILCTDNNPLTRYINATSQATIFAETYNHAFIANPPDLTEICMYGDGQGCSSGLDKGQVKVVVQITHPTFVLQSDFFRQPSITIPATATAGCFAPGGVEGAAVIPVAWLCEEITCSTNPITGEQECVCGGLDYIPTDGGCILGQDPKYIFFDQDAQYYWCPEWGGVPKVTDCTTYTEDPNGIDDCRAIPLLTCDSNSDGNADIIPVSPINPDHKWFFVNTDGDSCSATEETSVVQYGLSNPMYTHYWYPECGGVMGVVYRDIDTYRDNSRVILPVFDRQCQIPDPLTSHADPCFAGVSAIDLETDQKAGSVGNSQTNWYHMASAAVFDVTCVEDPNSNCSDPAIHAREWLEDNNPSYQGNQSLITNESSFEGCFVEGYVPGLIGRPSDGVETGAWTLYLVR